MTPRHARAMAFVLITTTAFTAVAARAQEGLASDKATEVVVKTHRASPNVPTTTEGVTAEALGKSVNVVTPEDTLRYVPNVLIRQRHFGDTQSPITTRTSGVGGSARSLIFVDGILVSALIGNNNTPASPKWGLITPDAIARVDVLYGPFSAAYSGNSMGSVIEFQTRMPTKLEGSLDVQGAAQDFKKYADDKTYDSGRIAGEIGDRDGPFAWRLSYNHLDTNAQPLTYATATASTTAGTANPVTGAFNDFNRTGTPIVVLGSASVEHQIQDNASGRLTWGVTPTLTAAYTFGLFLNTDAATANTYLRDASGQPVYAGTVSIDGDKYTIAKSAFSGGVYNLKEAELAQGLSLTSHTDGRFDYVLTVSDFDYLHSHQRSPTGALPTAYGDGAGTDAVLNGTGWYTLDAKGIWRPQGMDGANIVTFGAHQDVFTLDNPKYNVTDWLGSDDTTLASDSQGRTSNDAVWGQDAIQLGPRTKLTTGIRVETWRAYDGVNSSAAPALDAVQPVLKHDAVSPKVVLAFSPTPEWTLKASVGTASRFPTVTELYQTVTTGAVLSVPNPDLKPETSLSSELSAERVWPDASLRVSLFGENVQNALISQSAPLVAGSTTLYSYVQNIDRTRATGIEVVGDREDLLIRGLQLSGWVTYVDAVIAKDPVVPTAVGKNIPQLPRLRGALVLTYAPTAKWDFSLAVRYSADSYGTIDNSDHDHDTYQGFGGFTVVDLHVRYKVDRHWTTDVGVDNLNNDRYFIYHPFPQRTFIADLKYTY